MNTKQFDVIPIEDYGVVVDKEAKISKGDRFTEKYSVNIVRICQEDSLYNKIADGLYTYDTQFCSKVIATINKRIDDIPLIELPEINGLSILKFIGYDNESVTVTEKWIAEEVYKAAQKKYSEEDMRQCWVEALLYMQKRGLYNSCENFLQSLQPKLPKSVVLDMEHVSKILPYEKLFTLNTIEYKLKITNPSTNTIIPKEVNYEK